MSDANALGDADLCAYLRRIGHEGAPAIDRPTLEALHAAHVAAIPFENADVLRGKGVALDLDRLVAKLVHARRGGYCFEQNGLFAAVLRAIGFDVVPLGARVRLRATRTLPRTHQLLLVDVEGEQFIADVGFGAMTLLAPVPLRAGEVFGQGRWRYRLECEDAAWTLRMADGDAWRDLYVFTLEPQLAPDIEMANWYVSTHPHSRFVQTLTVQRATPTARHHLQDLEYTVDRGGGDVEVRSLAAADIPGLLHDAFGLDLPDGTAWSRA